jgi:purine-nucleoside phosphorylase
MSAVIFPLEVMAKLGIRRLIVTNASGAINRSFCPGDIVAISDHINFMGASPLRGPPISWT